MPYPNEHACRVRDDGDFREGTFRRVTRGSKSHGGKPYSVIRAILKRTGEWEDQSYRYPRETWGVSEARAHCTAHEGKRFEPAEPNKQAVMPQDDCCAGDVETFVAPAPRAAERFRTPIARGLKARRVHPAHPGLASRTEGNILRDADTIFNFSVVTRGAAEGHGFWIDEEFLDAVVAVGEVAERGIKTRFTHPGLCADGLGHHLGRTSDFERDGDTVRATLRMVPSAHKAPDGDLATYVMDLAQEDPEAFGASIVFHRDRDAERLFEDGHRDEEGVFRSPDGANEANLLHVRLKRLHAVDVVDEPAANPGGMFSRLEMGALAEGADRFLDWALGLTKNPPDEVVLGGVESQRAKEYLLGYLGRRNLAMVEEKAMTQEQTELIPDETEITRAREEAIQAERDRFARLAERFKDRPAFVLEQFQAGHDVAEAEVALKDVVLEEQRAEIEALKAAPPKPEPRGPGAEPIAHGEPTDGGGDFEERVTRLAREKGILWGDALRQMAQAEPADADAYYGLVPVGD